eukprot:GHVU01012986.1.p1 GENE.GHVU01012986.1~~GHVU01012986.1.p1  ORF type:complete len:178 (+),score=28.97 GHVU01012986.1:2731-3264(+)
MFFLDYVNVGLVALTDALIFYFGGPKCLLYLVGGTYLGLNFHPFAGHLISEHYQFPDGVPYQETYSYYGWFNLLTYNVGYHNEHHDFPRIPGSRLPLLTKMAPEFYAIPETSTWPLAMLRFLFTPVVTGYSRVKRVNIRGGQPAAPHVVHHEGAIPKSAFWGPEFAEAKPVIRNKRD